MCPIPDPLPRWQTANQRPKPSRALAACTRWTVPIRLAGVNPQLTESASLESS